MSNKMYDYSTNMNPFRWGKPSLRKDVSQDLYDTEMSTPLNHHMVSIFENLNLRNRLNMAVGTMLILASIYLTFLSTRLSKSNIKGMPLDIMNNVQSWRTRTVYHFLTDRFAIGKIGTNNTNVQCENLYDYCGGNFLGAKENLDYIQEMGFDAVLISPIVENSLFGYHGYWTKNFFKINPHFGNEDDLKSFIQEAHDRNMFVMVDVVANHIGCPNGGGPCGKWKEGDSPPWASSLPFNKSAYFHSSCEVNFSEFDQSNWQDCWLAGLPDLDQTNSWVRSQLTSWLYDLVKRFDFDGIRIDAGHLMPFDFVRSFRESSGVFGLAEFVVQVSSENERLRLSANLQDYATGTFSQSFLIAMDKAFLHKESMIDLTTHLSLIFSLTRHPDNNGIYLDNHDVERFYGRSKDLMILKNALVCLFMTRGIPFMYYGTEQYFQGLHDPYNREALWTHYDRSSSIYKFVQLLITFRKSVKVFQWAEQVTRFVDLNTYAFTRGKTFVVVSNVGSSSPLIRRWRISNHPYSKGTIICNILAESDCIPVEDFGIEVTLINGEPKIFHPTF